MVTAAKRFLFLVFNVTALPFLVGPEPRVSQFSSARYSKGVGSCNEYVQIFQLIASGLILINQIIGESKLFSAYKILHFVVS